MARKLLGSLLLVACATASTPPPPPRPVALPSAERDYDRDGFPDPRDRCPLEPGVAPLGCPDTDDDKDGVKSGFDRCPDVAGLGADGCPPPDTDADSVADADDRCPTELETRNGFKDGDGCDDAIPKDLAKYIGTIKGVQFASGKDVLSRGAKAVLGRAIEMLKKYPEVRLGIVEQQPDGKAKPGSEELAGRRAEAIKRHFVEKGLDGQRFEVQRPDSPATAKAVRRVEFRILVK